MSLDLLGAEEAQPRVMSWPRAALAVGVGALGAFLVPKHPVLAFLNGAAIASNAHAVVTKDRTPKNALKRIGRHLVATASSLALPKYPAIGYVAGAVAADLLIDGEGGGIIEEWADYEGIGRLDENVVDAEFTETPSRALTKV